MPTEQLAWRDTWLLGIDALDADHREMVRLMNLVFACAEGAGECEPIALAERLDAFMTHLRAHFAREEEFLRSIDYPGIYEHAREHALELAELVDLERSLRASRVCAVEAEHVEAIKRWFFNHVIAQDHKFADFYFEKLGSHRNQG